MLKTYNTQEENALPGHRSMKDRLTLLLCSKSSRDFKVKPLLVYHLENPSVKEKQFDSKECLGVGVG